MPIPNTITRTLDLAHPQEKVWAALTTLDGITGWFGSHADGEMTPGHDVHMRWEQYDNAEGILAIKVVDPMSVFAYSWSINGAPRGRRVYGDGYLRAQDNIRFCRCDRGSARLSGWGMVALRSLGATAGPRPVRLVKGLGQGVRAWEPTRGMPGCPRDGWYHGSVPGTRCRGGQGLL